MYRLSAHRDVLRLAPQDGGTHRRTVTAEDGRRVLLVVGRRPIYVDVLPPEVQADPHILVRRAKQDDLSRDPGEIVHLKSEEEDTGAAATAATPKSRAAIPNRAAAPAATSTTESVGSPGSSSPAVASGPAVPGALPDPGAEGSFFPSSAGSPAATVEGAGSPPPVPSTPEPPPETTASSPVAGADVCTPPEVTAPPAGSADEVLRTVAELEAKSVPQLRILLGQRGLSKHGAKAQLVARLAAALTRPKFGARFAAALSGSKG